MTLKDVSFCHNGCCCEELPPDDPELLDAAGEADAAGATGTAGAATDSGAITSTGGGAGTGAGTGTVATAGPGAMALVVVATAVATPTMVRMRTSSHPLTSPFHTDRTSPTTTDATPGRAPARVHRTCSVGLWSLPRVPPGAASLDHVC
ncbi:hypothetical protein FAF44_44425 [Nonomuraea sp. MG754425]|nr:hypothetical protein [Nonomuraea sp. MG754425]